MSRFWLIATFSLATLADVSASRLYFGNTSCNPQAGSGQVFYYPSGSSGFQVSNSGIGPVITGNVRAIYFTPSGGSQRIYGTLNGGNSNFTFSSGEHNLLCEGTSQVVGYTDNPWNGGVPLPAGSVTGEYDLTLGPEYVGQRVVVKDELGNVVFEGVVGVDGLRVFGEVERIWYPGEDPEDFPEFTMEFFRPGAVEGGPEWVKSGEASLSSSGSNGDVSDIVSWTESGADMPVGITYDRDGRRYTSMGGGLWRVTGGVAPVSERTTETISIAPEYAGGQWTFANADGGVMATGVIPSGGGSVTAEVSRYSGESGGSWYVQPLIAGGDGGVSLGSAISLGPSSGGSTITANPIPTPTPAPVPSPGPSPSPSPTPLPPDNVVPGAGADETTVSYEDPEWPIPEDDLNERLAEQSETMIEKLSSILGKFGDLGDGFIEGVNQFAGANLGGVGGGGCNLTMGTTNIQINVPSGIRSGTAVVAYVMTMIALAGLVSRLMDAS